MIDCIETDQFTLGILGRSGTRSYANYITRYYFDYTFELVKDVHLGRATKVLEDRPSIFHHLYSVITPEEFNTIDNKIQVVREPIARAESGVRIQYEPVFHGSPMLVNIDWDKIDYIIPFEDTHKYLNGHAVAKQLSTEDEKRISRITWNSGIHKFDEQTVTWSMEDYDYTEEIDTYNKVMKEKPRLPLELWIEYLNKVTCCNIPSKKLKLF